MEERPKLNRELHGDTFRRYYYLKEELIAFCRENGLPVSGGKPELTERITYFLDTGKVAPVTAKKRAKGNPDPITENTKIEEPIVFSEKHRAFFKERLGNGFSFFIAFQKWLKENPGKTYGEALKAYERLLAEKKTGKTTIGKQFEYNTYIRDFFADNPGKSLKDAIRCWNYKKSLSGHHRYESTDLEALD